MENKGELKIFSKYFERKINKDKLPVHIGIIMDGNGRWAKKRNLPRKLGHREGANNLKRIVKYANLIGIKYITVYAFSTENWKRSKEEVDDLMLLLLEYLKSFDKHLEEQENYRIVVIGEKENLSIELNKEIDRVVKATANNKGLTLVIALNYGGRQEILSAIKNISQKVKEEEILIKDITEETITQNVYTKNIPDPDLIIRTSGEQRMSNFLVWQSIYSELYFPKVLWPDYNEKEFAKAIIEYQNRDRRYGGR